MLVNKSLKHSPVFVSPIWDFLFVFFFQYYSFYITFKILISKKYLAHSKILIALECLINPEHFEYVSFFGQETLHLACMVKGDGVSFLY